MITRIKTYWKEKTPRPPYTKFNEIIEERQTIFVDKYSYRTVEELQKELIKRYGGKRQIRKTKRGVVILDRFLGILQFQFIELDQ